MTEQIKAVGVYRDPHLETVRQFFKTLSVCLMLAATAHLALIFWRAVTHLMGPVMFDWGTAGFFALHYLLNGLFWASTAATFGKGTGVVPLNQPPHGAAKKEGSDDARRQT